MAGGPNRTAAKLKLDFIPVRRGPPGPVSAMTVPIDRSNTPEFWDRFAARVGAAEDPVVVIREDQAERWAAGVGLSVEAYLDRLPALSDEDALVLILAEVGLRRETGEAPTAAEYQARFPRLAVDLGLQFDLLAHLHSDGDPG